MKKFLDIWILLALATFIGCSPAFWGGTASGGAGTVAGYEVHSHQEMKKLDEDLKNGKITQNEYDIRKDQIKRDSLFY